MIVPPWVFVAGAVFLAIAIVALIAWAATAEDDLAEYESEHGFALPKEPEDVEAMLLTWDEIRELPEVRR